MTPTVVEQSAEPPQMSRTHTHTHTVKEQSAQYSLCVQQLQVQIRCSVQVLSPFSVVFGSAAAPNWLRHDELILFLTINSAG